MNWDLEEIKKDLVGLALAEHPGDVNNDLPVLAKHLGLPQPEWSDDKGRMVFPWETEEWWDEY